MSSMGEHSLDRAIVLFDQVVRQNGALRWAARNEQAVIERKLGKPKDALALYDEVLKSDAGPSEKREALCGKGDIFFEMGTADPNNYQRAIEIYDQLASDKDEPIHWRDQALFKKGLCLEKKASAPMRLPRFTKYWRKTRIQIGGANSSGITRRGLTPRACWRKIPSGNLPLLSMKNSPQREAAEAKKREPVLRIFGWSISFGQINRRGMVAENLGLLS